jgi:hypothetical protein
MGRPRNNAAYIPRTFAIDVKTLIRLDREVKRLKTSRSRLVSGVLDGYFAFLDGKQPSSIPDPNWLLPHNRRAKPDVSDGAAA